MRILNRMLQFVLHLFKGSPQPPVVRRPAEPDDSWSAEDLPPGYTPIETQIRGQHIDGTGRWVGEDARVIQALDGALITLERGRTVKCGCGHLASTIEDVVTATGIRRGIGGTCSNCKAEGQDLRERNAMSPAEAEGHSLYCSRCGSHCDGCGRQDLCKRHTQEFQGPDGQTRLLCPDCFKKADRKARREKFFTRAVALTDWLLAEDSDPSKSSQVPPPEVEACNVNRSKRIVWEPPAAAVTSSP
jgi:hypothetical protein